VNCLPSTPETANFFSRERLARFSSRAIFVNIGRGSAVDEAALIEVLQNRKIGGAVLDVFKQEPLPGEHPYWDCPRTLVLQHTGGGYDEELIDKARIFVSNLNLYRTGHPLQNQINLVRGY
jgi:glyoxylate/hydroxypyruvate reductase A